MTDERANDLLDVFALAAWNSPYLNETQKRVVERLVSEIKEVMKSENYV